MARTLKTYVTNLGFFELAIAAPSMKAALEAWGMSHNAFAHGFAKQSDDAAIIAATLAHPGVVLKRAVGSSGAFTQDAELPKSLPNIKPPGLAKPAKAKAARKNPPRPAAKPAKPDRAAILSFEAARKKRDQARAQEEARVAKLRIARDRATQKAQAALDNAQAAHQRIMDSITADRAKLDRRADKEKARWESQREKLDQALDRARQD